MACWSLDIFIGSISRDDFSSSCVSTWLVNIFIGCVSRDNLSSCVSSWLIDIFISSSISRDDLSSCVSSLCGASNVSSCACYISLLSSCSISNWDSRSSNIRTSRNSVSGNISCLSSSYILSCSCNIWSLLSTNSISSCSDITCINCLLSFNLEWLIRIMNNLSK